jgi:hypothetical protein
MVAVMTVMTVDALVDQVLDASSCSFENCESPCVLTDEGAHACVCKRISGQACDGDEVREIVRGYPGGLSPGWKRHSVDREVSDGFRRTRIGLCNMNDAVVENAVAQSHGKKFVRQAFHHGDLRRALLATAWEVVEERGVSMTSLREVARRNGVAASSRLS